MSSTLSQFIHIVLVNIMILWKMYKKNLKLYKKIRLDERQRTKSFMGQCIEILHFYSTKENEIDLPEQGFATPKLWVQFQRNTMLNKTYHMHSL